ncbi:N(4)-(Beta-N-acetylglucosaminyl)-L-asparaginase-like [Ptychodera flava]|uniref:N(4)-(Beta-N-acetylglucosaminyl)-L-asparaginase- like n=1 Tax=Ptychodera flava TaxID=63121 RepID=UPI00396A02DF
MRLLSVYFIFMHLIAGEGVNLPLVIVTWEYPNATDKAYGILTSGGSSVDAVEEGCTFCEDYPSKCRYSVGFEGKVDENGEATLDAMIMDGTTLNVGAVGGIRRIKRATTVARHVLDYTRHSLLVGDQATDFAKDFVGLPEEDLNTDYNREVFESWKDENCQPNFWMNVQPDPTENCGPYSPSDQDKVVNLKETSSPSNHDTIGIVAVDSVGNVASAASTNGLNHKIPGRVGDSPIPGAGSYADNDVGGAAATGDGDVMIRFLPSYQTVENMRNGMDPKTAASDALRRIAVKYPQYMGAVIGATNDGEYGIACYGYEEVQYCTQDPKSGGPYCRDVTCDVTTSTSACLQSIALSWWISVVLISASLSAHLF